MQLKPIPNRPEPSRMPGPGPILIPKDSEREPSPLPEPAHIDSASAPASSRILIVGEARRADRVRKSLEDRSINSGLEAADVISVVSIDEATRQIAEQLFEVVVLIAPIRGVPMERALARLNAFDRSGSPHLRVALVPESFAEKRARNLYLRGAHGVFAWPDDVPVLSTLIDKTLHRQGAADDRGPEFLESVVRDRLDARQSRLSRHVGVEMARGIVSLSGRVSSLWAKRSLSRHAQKSPGVESVDTRSLEVDSSERSDAAIGHEVRALLDGTSTVDTSTVGVSVHGGRVVLLGVVLDQERDHVIELISMVPGVRSVNDKSLSSRIQKSRARALADRLQAALRRTTAGRSLRVAVVGRMAILRGVGTPDEIRESRRNLTDWIRESHLVRKVLDRAGPRLHRV